MTTHTTNNAPATSTAIPNVPSVPAKSVFDARGRWRDSGWGEASEPAMPYTYPLWKPSDLLKTIEDAAPVILSDAGGSYWEAGDLALVLGGGGVGKSRLVLTWAVRDILGQEFCGFSTGRIGKWLILGSENSARRVQKDLRRIMFGGKLSEPHTAELDANLVTNAVSRGTPMPPTDLSDPNVEPSLRLLQAEHAPDVVVVDPWEAFIDGGDVNDAAATRSSVEKLRRIFPTATLLIVHHAREGALAIKGAVGFDAGAFTKGSRTLMTMARFAINVAPRNSNLDAGKPHGLLLACGKCNNAKPFAARAVEMDEATGTYQVDTDFDIKSWVDNVDGKRKAQTVTIAQLVSVVRSGKSTTAEFVEEVKADTGASQSTIYRVLGDAVARGYLTKPAKGTLGLGPKATPTADPKTA